MDHVVSKETAEILMVIVFLIGCGLSGYGAVAIARDLGNWLAERDIEKEAKRKEQYGNRANVREIIQKHDSRLTRLENHSFNI